MLRWCSPKKQVRRGHRTCQTSGQPPDFATVTYTSRTLAGEKEIDMSDRFLPGVPWDLIEEMFAGAPGNEIESGKFDHPESSARLAANAFGYFVRQPGLLPPLPGCEEEGWPATRVVREETVNFPWRGGRHPVLDVLVETSSAVIGIESKRFEPFRRTRGRPAFSETYMRPEWGDRMKGYQCTRDEIRNEEGRAVGLDCAQLVKHALALRTKVRRAETARRPRPILFYVYAEPGCWPMTKEPVHPQSISVHRRQVREFAERVDGDEVRFVHCTYRQMLNSWSVHGSPKVRGHATEVLKAFCP